MRSMATGTRWRSASVGHGPRATCGAAGGSTLRAAPGLPLRHFWQDVRSFSSIEKIAPSSILMLRTRQVRPVVSFKLAS